MQRNRLDEAAELLSNIEQFLNDLLALSIKLGASTATAKIKIIFEDIRGFLNE